MNRRQFLSTAGSMVVLGATARVKGEEPTEQFFTPEEMAKKCFSSDNMLDLHIFGPLQTHKFYLDAVKTVIIQGQTWAKCTIVGPTHRIYEHIASNFKHEVYCRGTQLIIVTDFDPAGKTRPIETTIIDFSSLDFMVAKFFIRDAPPGRSRIESYVHTEKGWKFAGTGNK